MRTATVNDTPFAPTCRMLRRAPRLPRGNQAEEMFMNPEVTDVQNEMVAALAMPQRIASLAVSFGLDRYTMTKPG